MKITPVSYKKYPYSFGLKFEGLLLGDGFRDFIGSYLWNIVEIIRPLHQHTFYFSWDWGDISQGEPNIEIELLCHDNLNGVESWGLQELDKINTMFQDESLYEEMRNQYIIKNIIE